MLQCVGGVVVESLRLVGGGIVLLCVDGVVIVDLLGIVSRGLDAGVFGGSRQETLTFDGADFILFVYCYWLDSIFSQLALLGVGISKAAGEQHCGEFWCAVIAVISGAAVR